MEKASSSLKILKQIARSVSPSDYNYKNTVDRLKDDILSGLRVGFFIKGKPFVGYLNKETNQIMVDPLPIDFGEEKD